MDTVLDILRDAPATIAIALVAAIAIAFGRRSEATLLVVAGALPLWVGVAVAWASYDAGQHLPAEADLRAEALAEGAARVLHAPVPALLALPAWLLVGMARPQWRWVALAVVATRFAWRVEPHAFATGWPVAAVTLALAGVVLRPVAFAAITPPILLVSYSLTKMFPYVNYAVLPAESAVDRLERIMAASRFNHALLLLATALASCRSPQRVR